MQEIIQKIVAVDNTLRNLFKNKGELSGVDDWDRLIGCLMALEDIAQKLKALDETKAEE